MNIFGEVLVMFLGACVGIICLAVAVAWVVLAAEMVRTILREGL